MSNIQQRVAAVFQDRKLRFTIFAVTFGLIGGFLLLRSFAAITDLLVVEAEDSTTSGCAQVVTDMSASGGKALQFGTPTTCTTAATQTVGASLPITYSLSSLTGNIRYIATNGSDTSGNGTTAAPFATLAKAISSSVAGDTIVVRGGTYHGQGDVSFSKSLRIIAYPGEVPVFDGAKTVTGGWVAEGSFQYIPYTPQPVTDGVCSVATNNQCVSGDGVGKYPDQAWIGANQLKQVSLKTSLTNGTFWVDQTNKRLYMTASDVSQGNIEVSEKGRFLHVYAANTKVEGVRITRYSNTASNYGVVTYEATADYGTLKNVEVSESAYDAVFFAGGSDLNIGGTLDHVTVTRSNWMGVTLNYTNDFTMDSSKITDMNFNDEFTSSPVSGAIKTARAYRTHLTNNLITNNHSHAIWFDVSNYDTVIANNTITGNYGAGVFYEISDKLLLANNYIVSPSNGQPLKIAGSSGARLVNNTLVGGRDPIGVYTDDRSIAGCSDPANPPCGPWGNLRDTVRPLPATMDWMPRIDLMINNIIAYPINSGYCSAVAPVCFTQSNSTAYVAINTTIHQADTLRPKTYIDGNVYANGTGPLVAINDPRGLYTTTGAFSTAMAGSPVLISGFETAGKFGNTYVGTDGTPTATLAGLHSQAVAVPTDSMLNQFIPAGTRHYGVTYK